MVFIIKKINKSLFSFSLLFNIVSERKGESMSKLSGILTMVELLN